MQLRHYAAIAALILLVGALVVVPGIFQQSEQTPVVADNAAELARPNVKAAIGTKDDPYARFTFEQLRTADPSTGVVPPGMRTRELAYARTLPRHAAKTAALSWTRRGPFNVGGRTRGFGIDVRDKDIMLAGGVTGSIWRSTDGGATWTDSFADADLHSVTAIAQDTRSGAEDTWYAGTGELRGASGAASGASFFGNGLYKSTDNGVSWSALAATTTTFSNQFVSAWQFVWEVATDPSAGSSEVYAATAGGLYRSTNGGTSFSAVYPSGSTNTGCRTDVAVDPSGTVYTSLSSSCSVTGTGLNMSTSGGSGSFSDMAYPDGPAFARAEIAVSPADPDYVWVLADLGSSTHSLYLYNSSLVTCPGIGGAPSSGWCDYSAFVPARGTLTGNFDSQSSYNLYVEPHPTNTDIVLIGGTSLYRIDITGTAGSAGSGDTWIGGYDAGGASYARYNGGTDDHHPDQHSGSFLPPPYGVGVGENDPDIFVSGNDGGLHVTGDVMAAGDGNVDWTSLNNGYHTTQFYTVCFNSNDADSWVGGGLQDNGTWGTMFPATTTPWVEELTGDGSHCAVADNVSSPISTGTSRYVSAQGGLVYRLVYNAAGSYQGFTRVDPSGASGYLFINPFVIDPDDERIMYQAAGVTVWRNSNLEGIAMFGSAAPSTNWTNLTPPGVSGSVSALAVSSTGSRLYFGTSNGGLFRIDGADTYTPASAITSINSGLPSAFVSGIAVDPSDADRMMVTFSNYNTVGVWFSDDGGATWTNVEGNLLGTPNAFGDDGPSFRSVAMMPEASPTSYFVGTSTGLYSTDVLSGGSTVWTQEGPTDIDNTIVDMVRVRASDGFIAAGTHGHGLFTADASLPVEFGDIEAVVDGRDIVVRWETQSELNNAGFEIEYRLADDESYQQSAFIAGAGTSTEPKPYSFRVSDLLPGNYHVRLRQIDANGGSTYSPVIEVSIALDEPYVITDVYPNPVTDVATMSVVLRAQADLNVALYDVAGRQVKVLHNGPVDANSPRHVQIDAAGLAAGSYFVRIDGGSFQESKQIAVVR